MATYIERRSEVENYFDRTAADAWSRLTSDAPVGRIRATVRAGRDRMRQTLLSWLPEDMSGRRLLDAGCGTGALAVEAAGRGAQVVAIDLSPTLVGLARDRAPRQFSSGGSVRFEVGDMLDQRLGAFDHVVAMDSLIHYNSVDVLGVLDQISTRTRSSIVFTFAPRTPALAVMHALGRLFPRGNRAPAIEPVGVDALRDAVERRLTDWSPARSERVACGFYTSQAQELVRR